jgi:hypothetical protein
MTEKLDFIEDLRIIHIYSNNDLQYLRYGYEKIIKPRGDQVYIRFNRQRNLGFDIIDEEIKRKILVDWINEKVFPVENIRNQYKNNLFELNISEFLDPLQTESSYTRLCNFLSITECTKKSTEIIKEYLVAQPTRF